MSLGMTTQTNLTEKKRSWIGQVLFEPVRGPKWARVEQILVWRKEADKSPLFEIYRNYVSSQPFSRRPGRLPLLACFLFVVAAFTFPLLLPESEKLNRALSIACLAAIVLTGVVTWAMQKRIWAEVLQQAWEHGDLGRLSTAQIIGPSVLSAVRALEGPFVVFFYFGALLDVFFFGMLLLCLGAGYAALGIYWIVVFIYFAALTPIIAPVVSLLESIYWSCFSTGRPKPVRLGLPWLVCGTMVAAYCFALLVYFPIMDMSATAALSEIRLFRTFSPWIAGLAFISWALTIGLWWWLSLFAAQRIFRGCESRIREKLFSALRRAELNRTNT